LNYSPINYLISNLAENNTEGKLTLENDFLKRGLQNSISQSQRNGRPSHGGHICSEVSGENESLFIQSNMVLPHQVLLTLPVQL